jgi:hypothetical protein
MDQLALANSHIAQAKRIISRQKKLIRRLTEGGLPTTLACEVLEPMLSVYEVFLEDRRTIKGRLAAKQKDSCPTNRECAGVQWRHVDLFPCRGGGATTPYRRALPSPAQDRMQFNQWQVCSAVYSECVKSATPSARDRAATETV